MQRPLFWFSSLIWLALQPLFSQADELASTSAQIPLSDVLVIKSPGRARRSPVHTDPIEARLVAGQWHAPTAGESISFPTGATQTWESAKAAKDGALEHPTTRGGYIYWPVVSSEPRVLLLEAAGHNCVYVNGQPRAGDPYAYGYLQLPVLLHAGTNEFLFQCSRGGFHAKLTSPAGPLIVSKADATLPDLVQGEFEPVWGAVVLINATTNWMRPSLRAVGRGCLEHLVNIPPLGISKAPFLFRPGSFGTATNCLVTLEAGYRSPGSHRVSVRAQLNLRVRKRDQTCKRTFISAMDDSVQYYAVNPAPRRPDDGPPPALFLSLHGASVEAIGQAEAYSPKTWGHIICPTNRRPYGFDWEEWGRRDALEVLALAHARYHPDPTHIYLMGHSMGGHGTWQLGALFPDQFAAIGPSAGWISFMSYADTNRSSSTNAIDAMLRRSAAASDTLLLATNYLQEGIYILHGDADDNVPVTEAREMRQVLGQFHHDFDYHEQPGAGHWWDASDEPGADCVDWPPMFDFFAHHTIPADESLRQIRFVTVNPAVSARCHWVTVLAQEHPLLPSVVDVRCDPGKRRLVGTTTNISALWLDPPHIRPGAPMLIDLDGQKLENIPVPNLADCEVVAAAGLGLHPFVCLLRENGLWRVGPPPPAAVKSPRRSGPFREAFSNHMIFVFGTQGTPEENAWALAKARFDAENFYYRGNGAIPLLSDLDFITEIRRKNPRAGNRRQAHDSRNVIVYGHAECNAAWPVLLAASPVQVQRGKVRIGDREFTGDDLGCLFLQPNPRDDSSLVGVVAGSGLPGLRITERMPYFLSGAGFPDCLIVGADLLSKGTASVRAAGFFGRDWQVSTGEFAWGE